MTSDEIADDGESNDDKITLKGIRMKNLRGLIIAYLNFNSLRNKFESLKFLIGTNVDVLVIAEMKLNGTFPTAQFLIEGFKKPFRYDRNEHGGGLLIYVREGIPTKQKTEFKFPNDIEFLLHKKKWLLFGIYRPPSQNEKYFLENKWEKQ